jgi:hypothetical protein
LGLARRKFHDIHAATKSPIAEEALRRIAALHVIEADVRGQTAEQRLRVRQEQSRPLVDALLAWFTDLLTRLSGRSALAQRCSPVRVTASRHSGSEHFRPNHVIPKDIKEQRMR